MPNFIDKGLQFTSEEEDKFARRYENGYDLLIDQRYTSWLKIHHPAEYTRLTDKRGTAHTLHVCQKLFYVYICVCVKLRPTLH